MDWFDSALDFLEPVFGESAVRVALGTALVAAAVGVATFVAKTASGAAGEWIDQRRAQRVAFKKFLAEAELVRDLMPPSIGDAEKTRLLEQIDRYARARTPFKLFVVQVADCEAQQEMRRIAHVFNREEMKRIQVFILLSTFYEESLRKLQSDEFAALTASRQKTAIEQHFDAGKQLGTAAAEVADLLSKHRWGRAR